MSKPLAKAENRHRRPMAIAFFAVLTAAVILSGCASNSDKEDDDNAKYVDQPVEQIYNVAFTLLQRRRFSEAAKVFDEVERQHPYSVWARRSMLMSAFAYYEANKYDDAIESADRFLSLHPGNRDAPYAYYLKAICYYEQISDVGRDQERTLQALNALNDITRRYPTTEYARDARLKIDLTRDHLAGKEMYVGRYYLKHGQYVAAINRFKAVIETYQTTSHVPEALERLTEAYFAVGLSDEAQASASVLGYNFPNSEWYKDAYNLLVEHGVGGNAAQPVQVASVKVAPRPAPPPPAPPVHPNAAVPALPPPEADVTPQSLALTAPAPTTPAPATAAPVSPAPSAAPSAPVPSTSAPATATASTTTTTTNAPRKNTDPYKTQRYQGYGGDEDLQDSWVRRLFRNLF
jgi:outer membrane protein assembly factor BamD